MTTYSTGNEVPSTDVRDLLDNSENLDNFSNGQLDQYADRLGVLRKSLAGLRNDFYELLAASGFETEVLTYADGVALQVDRPTQLIERASAPGTLYSVKLPSSFPIILSGTWATDEPLLVVRVDQFLRDELAAPDGGSLIGFEGRTVDDRIRDAVDVSDYGALFDGSDETAKLQEAIDEAISRGSRFVRVDGEINAPGTLSGRSNVFFIGSGKLINVYRRAVYPVREHELVIRDIDPIVHLPNLYKTNAPVVAIMGDSLSTYTANALGRQSSLASIIERKMRADNPGKSFSFYNRSIGGQTWSTANAVAIPSATAPWYTVPTDPWLPYVEALAPDLVVLAFGMNDAENFARTEFDALITKIKAWAKPADIILVTNPVPTLEPHPNFADFGTEASQEGRDYAAGYVRSYARRNGIGLIDLNRYFNIVRDGRDIQRSELDRIETNLDISATGAYIADEEVRDFSITTEIFGDAAAISAIFDEPSGPIGVRVGRNGSDTVFIRRNAGNFRLEFYVGGLLYRTVDTGVAIPTSTFNLIFEKVGQTFLFRIGNDETTADIHKEFNMLVHGGVFAPRIGYHSALYATGPFRVVTYDAGRDSLYLPSITNDEFWATGASSASTQLPHGGNGVNHPTSLGAAALYGPAIMACDFRTVQPREYRTLPVNPAAVAFLGATSGGGAVRVGSIGSAALYFSAANVDHLILTPAELRALTNDSHTLGASAQRWSRVFSRKLSVDNLSVFADNAAAIAGGLAAGEFYRTAAGAVMVRF